MENLYIKEKKPYFFILGIVEELESLKTTVDSLEQVKTYWWNTFKKRQALLKQDRLSVHGYISLFPCLSDDVYAIALVRINIQLFI